MKGKKAKCPKCGRNFTHQTGIIYLEQLYCSPECRKSEINRRYKERKSSILRKSKCSDCSTSDTKKRELLTKDGVSRYVCQVCFEERYQPELVREQRIICAHRSLTGQKNRFQNGDKNTLRRTRFEHCVRGIGQRIRHNANMTYSRSKRISQIVRNWDTTRHCKSYYGYRERRLDNLISSLYHRQVRRLQ